MNARFPRLSTPAAILAAIGMLTSLSASAASDEQAESPKTTFAIGAGAERMPKWLGANTSKWQKIPFLDINWQNRIELSTTDGLIIDALHQESYHGGLIGTLTWGRSTKDLGDLARAVPTLNNTLQGGVYFEYQVAKPFLLGVRWRHDIQQTGAAYTSLYAEYDFPTLYHIEQSLKFETQFMNGSAMRRNFAVSASSAAALGVSEYQPHAGLESSSLSYQVFLPTSESTGIVAGMNWAMLQGDAAHSPLVKNYGSRIQRSYMAAFMVHF